MPDFDYSLEMLSFEEKIALARLEEAKAHERVLELGYQQARFAIDWNRTHTPYNQESPLMVV